MGLPALRVASAELMDRVALRQELEGIITRAIKLLDALDAKTEDLEPPEDDESLGWSATGAATRFDVSAGFVDLEENEAVREPRQMCVSA